MNMNTDKDIVDDLQVRCVTYTLLRKWPTMDDATTHEVLEYALRAARLLEMEEWQGFEAHRAWLEVARKGI